MWYLDGRKWNDTYDSELDSIIANPDLFRMALSFEADSSLVEARVHGNPHLDTANLGWHQSTATKRAEVDVYDGDAPAIDVTAFTNWILGATAGTESIYLIDADDPELVELGEDGVHERLTSHLADPISAPEPAEWTHDMAKYLDRMLMEAIANGDVPPALNQQVLRARMGLGAGWIGAPID